jgi:fatty acid desaturase
MTHYRTSRRLASVLTFAGWLLCVFCLLVLVASLARILPPLLAVLSWLPLLTGSMIGLAVVLLGHVVRAFFDIADAVAFGQSEAPNGQLKQGPLRGPDASRHRAQT